MPGYAINLTTATPREIDERLMALYLNDQRASHKLNSAIQDLHYALGERDIYFSPTRKRWPTTTEQALKAVRARGTERLPLYAGNGTFASTAEAYDNAIATLKAIEEQTKPFHEEFARRPWSRFFYVQNNNGHIHSSMICSTCNRNGSSTQFAWNPELSGLDEAAAVEKLGPKLCTVCFPTAPVEWTAGTPKPARCAGSGRNHISGTGCRVGMRQYGECPVCHETQLLTGSGIRAHKPKKENTEQS